MSCCHAGVLRLGWPKLGKIVLHVGFEVGHVFLRSHVLADVLHVFAQRFNRIATRPTARKVSTIVASARLDFQWESPFVDTPKIRLYEGLPQFLRDAFMSCVKPSREAGGWAPCLECFKCDELREAGTPGYSSSDKD